MFSADLAALFVTAGVGVVTPAANRSIFRGSNANVPVGDGPYISIRDTGGSGPERIQNKRSSNFEYPGAQIIVRAADPDVAYVRAKAAFNAVMEVINQTVNGTFYLNIKPMQEPVDSGLDDTNKRTQFVFNVIAMKRP